MGKQDIHMKTNTMNKLREHNVNTELKRQKMSAMVAMLGFLKTQGHLPNVPNIFGPLCFLSLWFFFFVFFFRATPVAYGGNQPRGPIGAVSCLPTPRPQQRQI